MSASLEIMYDNTDATVKEIASAIDVALEQIGLLAEGHVMGTITKKHIVDTGRLRNSITHLVLSDDAVAVGTNVEYAKFVEFGTHKMKARPYLVPTVKEHLDEYREVLKKVMENA